MTPPRTVTVQPTHAALEAYYHTLDTLKNQAVSSEGNLRRAFGTLLSAIATPKKWTLVEEDAARTASGRNIYYDGVLRDEWKLPHGRWEAKDKGDNLDQEIRRKRESGYVFDNILFEDTQTVVLFQDNLEVGRTSVRDRDKLAKLLTQFLNHEVAPFTSFNQAVSYFKDEITTIASGLKDRIESAHKDNRPFKAAYDDFFTLCQNALNPNISKAAVDEMLIQHMLTERLISKLFVEEFIRRNIIASKVETVIDALTSGSFNRKDFLGSLDRFYTAIEDAAERLANPTDKQEFINTIYERFFQGYSVKTADTHGIVYTPQPIVDFMCASVEEVLKDEFGLDLGEEGVTILDPATGTGNFVVHLLNRVDERYLHDFYAKQLFANEVMLMPYYIAALNIERTYFERTGKYQPFEGLCFVDTLDMQTGVGQLGLFTEANTERVARQNAAPITVIIGNPPYNVGQLNENDNNKNRAYNAVDKRIRETYVKDSAASNKNSLYDMYVRFYRWAVDRLSGRNGVVCFVTNNSFIDNLAFDGMRKHLMQDFTRIYVLDLQGNIRKDSMRDGIPLGEKHTVFGLSAMVGVSIMVLVKNDQHQDRKLFYHTTDWRATREQKFEFLRLHIELQGRKNALNTITWQEIKPDKKYTWLQPDNVEIWEKFLSIGSKEAKKIRGFEPETIFRTYSGGVKTNRDEIVYDFNHLQVSGRVQSMINAYNAEVDRYKRSGRPKNVDDFVDYTIIKWSAGLKNLLQSGEYIISASESSIRRSMYRPFVSQNLMWIKALIERTYQFTSIFPISMTEKENRVIWLKVGSEIPMFALMANSIVDLLPQGGSQCFPLYTYDEDGTNRRDNITDWSLKQFQTAYNDPAITKVDIFYYVYAALHHPGYRQQFAQHLKKELPRIPLIGASAAATFRAFATAGRALADLHLNYENGTRAKLDWQRKGQVDYRVKKMKKTADNSGIVYNDTLTLAGIPAQAWDYKLGNRSALDWIIDQYQVKTDKRSGITSDPNQYAEDEQYIVKLIERVTHLSIETVKIVASLAAYTL